MQTFSTIILIVACVLILVSFFRMITDEKGLVKLNQYRFVGCLPDFIKGIYWGCCDLKNRVSSSNATSVIILLIGVGLLIGGFLVARM